MSRYINLDEAKARISQLVHGYEVEQWLDTIPSVDIDRPQGEWVEKTKFHNADDDPIIEEWQSAKCSVCGKYHTTPYLYYFDDYNFCPNCGCRMRGGKDD